MKKKHTRFLALLSSAALACTCIPLTVSAETNTTEETTKASSDLVQYAEGEALVMYKGAEKTISAQDISSDLTIAESYTFTDADFSINSTTQTASDFTVSLVKSSTLSTEELITKLQNSGKVLYAEPNYIFHASEAGNDTYYDHQWSLNNSGQNAGTAGCDINADTDLLTPQTDDEQVVAIIDTGVNYELDDLSNRMWKNPFASSGKLNGTCGYDFVDNDTDPMDEYEHGTHVAGIIDAQTDDANGICGVAANSNTKIMALRAGDVDGSFEDISIIGAYNYIYRAQQLGVNVIAVNDSWGGYIDAYYMEDTSSIILSLIDLVGENGCFTIAAAGNEGYDLDTIEEEEGVVEMPGGFDSDYIITVAASTESDDLANFSCYGKQTVDIAAPGVDILSTVLDNRLQPSLLTDAQKETYLSCYEDFSDFTSDNSALVVDQSKYFGLAEDDAASLSITFDGDNANVYVPITVNGESVEDPYFSMAYQYAMPETEVDEEADIFDIIFGNYSEINVDLYTYTEDDGYSLVDNVTYFAMEGSTNYWNLESFQTDGITLTSDKTYYIGFTLVSMDESGSDSYPTIWIDDLAFTCSGVDAEDILVPYDYFSGTSMATPTVTGAYAAICAAYPDLTMTEKRALLLGCTRSSASVSDSVKTGILDLSYLSNPNPFYSDMCYLSDTNQLMVTGSELSNYTVKANNTVLTPCETEGENTYYYDLSDYALQWVDCDVYSGEDSIAEDSFYIFSGNTSEYKTTLSVENYYDEEYITEYSAKDTTDNVLISDYEGATVVDVCAVGETLYVVYNDGTVYSMAYDCPTSFSLEAFEMDTSAFISETETYSIISEDFSNVVTDGVDLYTIMTVDLGYASTSALMRYSTENLEWEFICDFSTCNTPIEGAEIAYYQGTIYVLGGGSDDAYTDAVVTVTFTEEESVIEEVTTLPTAYGFGFPVVQDETLYYTLGVSDETGIFQPTLLSYTDEWTETELDLDANALGFNAATFRDGEDVVVGENGIYYVGLGANDLGDIFCYNPEDSTLTSTGYSLFGAAPDGCYNAEIVDGVLMVIYTGEDGLTLEAFNVEGTYAIQEYSNTDSEGLGDVNFDNSVDITDAYEVLSYYAAHAAGDDSYCFTDEEGSENTALFNADVDGDGSITITDAAGILEYYANAAAGNSVSWESIFAVG